MKRSKSINDCMVILDVLKPFVVFVVVVSTNGNGAQEIGQYSSPIFQGSKAGFLLPENLKF